MGGLHALFASHSSWLPSSLTLPALVPRRSSEAMPCSLAAKGVQVKQLIVLRPSGAKQLCGGASGGGAKHVSVQCVSKVSEPIRAKSPRPEKCPRRASRARACARHTSARRPPVVRPM
eukprot:3317164-Prymnesium_polylepis.1